MIFVSGRATAFAAMQIFRVMDAVVFGLTTRIFMALSHFPAQIGRFDPVIVQQVFGLS
jgi:hypothetical protein